MDDLETTSTPAPGSSNSRPEQDERLFQIFCTFLLENVINPASKQLGAFISPQNTLVPVKLAYNSLALFYNFGTICIIRGGGALLFSWSPLTALSLVVDGLAFLAFADGILALQEKEAPYQEAAKQLGEFKSDWGYRGIHPFKNFMPFTSPVETSSGDENSDGVEASSDGSNAAARPPAKKKKPSLLGDVYDGVCALGTGMRNLLSPSKNKKPEQATK